MLTNIEQLQRLAYQDSLTGLPNENFLMERIKDVPLERRWFIVLDLNGFKKAQDQNPEGHAYGNKILVEFADFLRKSIRLNDCCKSFFRAKDVIAVRLHGDEFVILTDNKNSAQAILNRIRYWNSADGNVSVSGGIGETIKLADAAMFAAKAARK